MCGRPPSEHSWDTRSICNFYLGATGSNLTKDQEDAIYAAYLGISVLKTMCRKANLKLGEQRSQELLTELGVAFPFIPERVGLSALR
jgi:hypothetical protein